MTGADGAACAGGRALHGHGSARPATSRSRTGPCCWAPWPKGLSAVRGLSDGDDVARTRAAVEWPRSEVRAPRATRSVIDGRTDRLHRAGRGRSTAGNSGTGMRLLAGLVAGLAGATHPGRRRSRCRPADGPHRRPAAGDGGRRWTGRGERCLPPIEVPGGPLHGIEWTAPVASAQVKSAILLAGLRASGEPWSARRCATRAHTEEMLAAPGADIDGDALRAGRARSGCVPGRWPPFDLLVPGDPSQAAFWVVAGCLVAGQRGRGRARLRRRRPHSASSTSSRAWGRGVDCRPGTDRRTVDRHGPLRARCAPPWSRRPRSPRSTRCPILAVAAAAATGPPSSATWASSGSKRSTAWRRRPRWSRPSVPGRGRRATTLAVHGAGGPLAPRRASTAAATTAWPWRPRWRRWRPGTATARRRLRRGGHQLPRLPRRPGDAGRGRAPSEVAAGRARAVGVDDDRILAIDGPAGSGKSTVSRALAERLGVAAPRHRRHVPGGGLGRPRPRARPGRRRRRWPPWPRRAHIEVDASTGAIDGVDVDHGHPLARGQPGGVGRGRQPRGAPRAWWPASGAGPPSTAAGWSKGRDIGTVVFPDAQLKVYLTASPEERAAPPGRRVARGRGPPRPHRLAPGRLAAGGGRRGARARHHRSQRRGCGRGGAVVAVTPEEGTSRADRRRRRQSTPRPPGAASRSASTRAGRSATGSPASSSPASSALWFRPKVTGRQHIPAEGPVILAPVHRSFADFGFAAFVTPRKLFFMAKDDLWKSRCSAGCWSPSAPSRCTASRPTARPCSGPRRCCEAGAAPGAVPRGPTPGAARWSTTSWRARRSWPRAPAR